MAIQDIFQSIFGDTKKDRFSDPPPDSGSSAPGYRKLEGHSLDPAMVEPMSTLVADALASHQLGFPAPFGPRGVHAALLSDLWAEGPTLAHRAPEHPAITLITAPFDAI